MTDKKRKNQVLIIYCLLLFSIWTLFESMIKAQIDLLSNVWLTSIIKSGIIKNIVWTVPALVLIAKYSDNLYVPRDKMWRNRIQWRSFWLIFAVFTIYVLFAGFLTHGRIAISPDFEYHSLVIVAFVGLTEETVFRGWLLNATVAEKTGKQMWFAVVINALLFLAIHFPRWISEGIFIANFQSFGFLSIIALSIVFSWTFIKNRSVVPAIILHMYWDLLVFLFI